MILFVCIWTFSNTTLSIIKLFDFPKKCIEIAFHLFCKEQAFTKWCRWFRSMGVYSDYSCYLFTFLICIFSEDRCAWKTGIGHQLITNLMFLSIYFCILTLQYGSLSIFSLYGMILAVIRDISAGIPNNFDWSTGYLIELNRRYHILYIILLLNFNQSQFSPDLLPKIFIHGGSTKQHLFFENMLFKFIEIC